MSDRIKHSDPISIPAHHNHRNRSESLSSDDDENNSPPLQTPSYNGPSPRVATHSPSTSPILSYFFQSPTKPASNGLPPSPTTNFGTLGRGFSAKPPQEKPIFEEDEDRALSGESPLMRHARRMSTSAAWVNAPTSSRFNPTMPVPEQSERGVGLLRRLSLGPALVRPQVSPPHPPTALAPAAPVETPRATNATPTGRRKQRRASMLGVPGEGTRSHRPPSPMGERILKGHFDGFN